MPKLRDTVVEQNKEKIEEAALRLFILQGFHGTSVRDIAYEAGVSIGNIYNYYPTKEALYLRLVRRYSMRMGNLLQRTLKPLLGRVDAVSLHALARVVRDIVENHGDYWRLMYIDVTEFGNKHFAHNFRKLSANLEKLAGGYPADGVPARVHSDIDPSLAYTSIYLQFFTYFLVEKLFGGKGHLGLPEDAAIDQIIRIFTSGIAGAPRKRALKVRRQGS